jgi:hypothetical protein
MRWGCTEPVIWINASLYVDLGRILNIRKDVAEQKKETVRENVAIGCAPLSPFMGPLSVTISTEHYRDADGISVVFR